MEARRDSCPNCKTIVIGFVQREDGSLFTDKHELRVEHDESGAFIQCQHCGHAVPATRVTRSDHAM